MSESLRDQLLKSGLAQKLKVETKTPQAKTVHGKPQPSQTRGSVRKVPTPHQEPNLAHAYALRAKQEKDEREQVQRETERLAKEKRERKQKLAAVLQGKSLTAAEADVVRHFPHGNKIRRIYCTPAQLIQLNRGELAVVQLAGRYLLVERAVALDAQAIDENAMVLLCDPNAQADDDVPPDLVW